MSAVPVRHVAGFVGCLTLTALSAAVLAALRNPHTHISRYVDRGTS